MLQVHIVLWGEVQMSAPLLGLIILVLLALAAAALLAIRAAYRQSNFKGEAERRQQRIAWAKAWDWVHGRNRHLRITDARKDPE